MERDDRFIKREYRKALIPILFSVLGGTINTLIDSAFVSQSEGENALAAVGLCMPIYLVLCVIGVLFGTGSSIVAARCIGKKQIDEASRVYYSALSWLLILGLIITVGGALFAGTIARLIAQNGSLVPLVYDYGFVTILGTFPTILIYLPIRYLQLEGKNKRILDMTIMMIVIDVVLDYVFLFVLRYGLRGAAWASVISTGVATLYGFFLLQRGRTYRFSVSKLRFSHTLEILRFGSNSAVGNLVDALKSLMLNTLILAALGSPGMAVWAVLNSLAELALTVTTGVPQTANPMIGVYYPSRENPAIRTLVRLQMYWGLSILSIFGVIITIGHRAVEKLFVTSENLLMPLLYFSLSILLDMVISIWMRYLNTIGRVAYSNVINILRKFFFPVGIAYILAAFKGTLWLFLPVGEAFAILVSLMLLVLIHLRERSKNGTKLSFFLLLDDSIVKFNRVLDFSISPNDEEVCDAAEKIRDFCEYHHMDEKLLMRLSLSIEELLVVLIAHIPHCESIDLRAFVTEDETGLQVRIAGDCYDPFTESEKEDNAEELMGVIMMKKMAKTTNYYYALGMNTLHIFFERPQTA